MGLYDAIPVPMMQPDDTLQLLRKRFPELAHLFSDPEHLDPEAPEPYHSYERLAEEILRRQNDSGFLEPVYAFLNELALSREYWLEEAFGVALMENLAQDAAFAAMLYPHINDEAQRVLKAIEQQVYGRSLD